MLQPPLQLLAVFITSDGGSDVIERGVCWAKTANPDVGSNVVNAGTGVGSFSCTLTNLQPSTTYYVRAYACNSVGVSYGSQATFTTLTEGGGGGGGTSSYTVSVSANPSDGGSVTGGGTYAQGQSCTVSATEASGYTFANWTENGNAVSTSADYTFTVNADRALVANFTYNGGGGGGNSYTVSVSANPSDGGSVTGGGTYAQGQSCTVSATEASGYTFTNWTENGNPVSTSADYIFTVNADRALVANFTYNGGGGGNAPQGAINGHFTINANGDQVYFSQGNLQYQASTGTWRFAANQYDYIGYFNANISSSYSGWIDLFSWGTSGYNHGAVCYQPWSTSTNDADYYAYGQWTYNLYDQTGQADWGYNAISNGGNTPNTWRTLTGGFNGEWDYVFNTRSTSSGIRYAKAQVLGVNGVILLPDDWSSSYYSLSNTNNGSASFGSNVISSSNWANNLQSHGAVFLPAAGYRRNGTSVNDAGTGGFYWSSMCFDSDLACSLLFIRGNVYPQNGDGRCSGFSVRLVCPAE